MTIKKKKKIHSISFSINERGEKKKYAILSYSNIFIEKGVIAAESTHVDSIPYEQAMKILERITLENEKDAQLDLDFGLELTASDFDSRSASDEENTTESEQEQTSPTSEEKEVTA